MSCCALSLRCTTCSCPQNSQRFPHQIIFIFHILGLTSIQELELLGADGGAEVDHAVFLARHHEGRQSPKRFCDAPSRRIKGNLIDDGMDREG